MSAQLVELGSNGDNEGIALVDTTSISVGEARDAVIDWLLQRIAAEQRA